MEALKDIRNQRILFSPLNWGWGHVSRAIPLLQQLQYQHNEIHVACSEKQRAVFKEYLKDIEYVDWPGYPFRFKGKGNFAYDLLRSSIHLYRFGKKEKEFVRHYVSKENISLVLSDHRYFFRDDKVKSVFVSHQLNLPLPRNWAFVQKTHAKLMHHFQEIWIVDDEQVRMSGKLGKAEHGIDIPYTYIGLLSRFSGLEEMRDKKWTTILVSGPEPYANNFYHEQKRKIANSEEHWCILYNGKCEEKGNSTTMTWKEMDQRLKETKKLIARSGYSTVMDAYYLQCETRFYPTPGQWEQEYLAEIHHL